MSSSEPVEQKAIASTSELPTIMSEPAFVALAGDATIKALGIDELTLVILKNVPTEHLSKLRRISKRWDWMISSIGYAVEPVFVDPESIKRLQFLYNENIRYEVDVAIGVNPAINSCAELPSWLDKAMIAVEIVKDPTQLLSKRHEFITDPPIATITLGLRDQISSVLDLNSHELTATLRDNAGIRIGLPLDTLDKMRVQALQPFQHDPVPSLLRPIQPVAFFRYSGPAVITYQEQDYEQFAYDRTNDGEDQESEVRDSGDDSDEDDMNEEDRHPSRRILRCPTHSEQLSMLFEDITSIPHGRFGTGKNPESYEQRAIHSAHVFGQLLAIDMRCFRASTLVEGIVKDGNCGSWQWNHKVKVRCNTRLLALPSYAW